MFKVVFNHWGKVLVLFTVLMGVLLMNAALATSAEAGGQVPVQRFADQSIIDNTHAKLKRKGDEVSINLHTRELTTGDAYTVWWVVFNDPDNCGAVCSGDDIDDCLAGYDDDGENPDLPNCDQQEISVLWATGKVVNNPAGVDKFQASLEEGNPSGDVLFGPGLIDAQGAEIHMVVRTHGPDTGDPTLTTTFGGGCSEATGGEVGAEGYDCEDVQFSIHKP